MRPELDRDGRLFVIVDRGTFSAAVSLASDLQRETHAVFVGEPTGGAPNSPGDPAHVKLPASGIVVRISTLFWYGSDPRDPRAFIAPDLPAMPSWADWIGHRDPALAAIDGYRPSEAEATTPPNTRWASPAQLEAKVPRIAW
jgi:C-terminal processing protease CtpA/Prc